MTRQELGWVAGGLPVPRTAVFGGLMVVATGLWLYDGLPPTRGAVALLRGVARSASAGEES